MSIISPYDHANDEYYSYSGGGDLIYWNICCNRCGGSFDITNAAKQGESYIGYGGMYYSDPGVYSIKTYGNDQNGWGT